MLFSSHGNFTQLDFKNFDHFYFYNAFYENLAGTDKIDDSIDYSVNYTIITTVICISNWNKNRPGQESLLSTALKRNYRKAIMKQVLNLIIS